MADCTRIVHMVVSLVLFFFYVYFIWQLLCDLCRVMFAKIIKTAASVDDVLIVAMTVHGWIAAWLFSVLFLWLFLHSDSCFGKTTFVKITKCLSSCACICFYLIQFCYRLVEFYVLSSVFNSVNLRIEVRSLITAKSRIKAKSVIQGLLVVPVWKYRYVLHKDFTQCIEDFLDVDWQMYV